MSFVCKKFLNHQFFYYFFIAMLVGSFLAGMPQARAVAPVTGQITSPFGWREDPINGTSRFHAGVDIAAETGTPVLAAQAGYVVFSGTYGGYGEAIVLDHGHTLYTLYGHNSERLVTAGQYVSPGQIISRVGSTGRTTGPHLHFEVHYNRQYVEPLAYLNNTQSSIAAAQPILQNGPPVPASHNGNSVVALASPNTVSLQNSLSQQSATAVSTPHRRHWGFHRAASSLVTGSDPSSVRMSASAAPRISNYSSPVIRFVGMENALVPPIPEESTPVPQLKRENRRLVAPPGAYGHNAVEVVKGNQIETVRF